MTITLATLAQATAQEVFDQVATHLLKQNQKALMSGFGCQYRYEGLKCAAGCLISDEEYSPKFEVGGSPMGGGWRTLVGYNVVPYAHDDLISCLQSVHDGYLVSEWPRHLDRVASQYGLVPLQSAVIKSK